MSFLTGMPMKLYGYLAALLAVLAAIWRVYAAGKNAARVEGLETELKNVDTRNKVEDSVARAPISDIDKRLQPWTRD